MNTGFDPVKPIEYEAKYTNPEGEIKPGDLVDFLTSLGMHPDVEEVVLNDVYFDTALPDRSYRLGTSGLSLRIRTLRTGDRETNELTGKRLLTDVDNVHVREELTDDLSQIEAEKAVKLINRSSTRLRSVNLIRRFVCEQLWLLVRVLNHRTVLKTTIGGSRLELCHDEIVFTNLASGREAADHEIEIELETINPRLMEVIISNLRRRFPTLAPQREDKYRRALRVILDEPQRTTFSYQPIRLERVNEDEIAGCLEEAPSRYREIMQEIMEDTIEQLSGKSQLSVLPVPREISLALGSEDGIWHAIGGDSFLHDQNRTLPESCFLAVDAPRSPLKYFTHTRAQHALDVSSWAMKLARRTGLTESSVAMLGVAGLRHDLGHPALSHSGEVIVVATTGENHEQRTQRLVEKDEPALASHGLSLRGLQSVLREEGIGQILGLADTLAYLIRDGRVCGNPMDEWVSDVIAENFAFDTVSPSIVIKDRLQQALQSLLDFRFEMYRRVYYHPYSRIAEEMQQAALRFALDKMVITLENLLGDDDPNLIERLVDMTAEYPESKALVVGFFEDYGVIYLFRPAADFEEDVSLDGLREKLQSCGFRPFDYVISSPDTRAAGKTIRGRTPDGQPIVLRAEKTPNFHPYDGRTLVAFAPSIRHKRIISALLQPRP